MDVAPFVRCTSCGAPITISPQYVTDYFFGNRVTCSSCSTELDWWEVVLCEIHDNFMLNQAFMHIGAQSKIFTLPLKPNQRSHYKLSDYGIPEEARVLYVNYSPYTPGGKGYFPIEITGNSPTRKYPRDKVSLWPMPLGDGSGKDTEVSVYVTWVEHSDLDESWKNLVDAFELYASDQYESSIVPANVAVESTCSIFLAGYLEKVAGKDRVSTFLENGATYSHQLNIVIPLIVELNKLAVLPNHIRGSLNLLRSLRNQMAHRGKPDTQLSKKITSEVLCAALFGFQYIQYVQSALSGSEMKYLHKNRDKHEN